LANASCSASTQKSAVRVLESRKASTLRLATSRIATKYRPVLLRSRYRSCGHLGAHRGVPRLILAVVSEHCPNDSRVLVGEGHGRTPLAAKSVCTVVLVVDAKNERSAAYYHAHGFIPFPSAPLRLFKHIDTIIQAPGKRRG